MIEIFAPAAPGKERALIGANAVQGCGSNQRLFDLGGANAN